ncbi:cell division protein ZapA [Sediminibacterium ginsengisoli]|uniref:Cell division protein ZapA n=1 Tax=Sediminibacterium ginsengisoli TaxID=413434 RepID=A0A1T4JWD6_9BACT|nr:cell division protein ZapA [Sediminibacterium ginsengisoli]SJZ34510.1 cell division protein ZapA [Sediminibacterium ginsengisoli]
MAELIPVNIVIADRSYRLKIQAADEEVVRKTAALINDKINEFRGSLAGKDMQDYVAMVLLWFATEKTNSGIDAVKWNEAAAGLTAIEKAMEKALAETEKSILPDSI